VSEVAIARTSSVRGEGGEELLTVGGVHDPDRPGCAGVRAAAEDEQPIVATGFVEDVSDSSDRTRACGTCVFQTATDSRAAWGKGVSSYDEARLVARYPQGVYSE
jgi:hypothetical protein